MTTPFQDLQKAHPTFKFRNKSGIAQAIQLIGGDSVQVQPGAESSVPSDTLFNFPDSSWCKILVPPLADLVASGLIQSVKKAETPASASPKQKNASQQTSTVSKPESQSSDPI